MPSPKTMLRYAMAEMQLPKTQPAPRILAGERLDPWAGNRGSTAPGTGMPCRAWSDSLLVLQSRRCRTGPCVEPHGHRWPRPPGNPFIEPRPRQRGSDAAAGCGGAMFIAQLLLPWGCWLIPQPRSPVVRSDGCPMPSPVDADPG